VAERRRRGTGPADDRHDDVRDEDVVASDLDDDAVEDDDDDIEADAELDADDDDDDELTDEDDDDEVSARGGGTATKERTKSDAEAKKSTKKKAPSRVGIFGRFANFFREIVAELRKVIWPTRKELITYTTVVVVFVTIMLTVVGLLDVGFGKAILWIFGNKTTS
jgi:preprotein translocase subunit SecE